MRDSAERSDDDRPRPLRLVPAPRAVTICKSSGPLTIPATRLGQLEEMFTIEQLAGFGGMGQVYRARDRRSGELVALRVMHDAERIDIGHFAREAQLLAALSHPGIVRYIDNGITVEGSPY